MTHDTDCKVLEEAVERLNEVADAFQNGHGQGRDMAEDLGYEQLGSGAGRSVWAVTDENQVGPRDRVTREAPCVVKFALGNRNPQHSGTTQNRQEVQMWQRFPPRVREAEPPVVAPVKDWNENYEWVTMPLVEHGGSPQEVEEKLARLGWECGDLHYDNVGNIHGHSVALDFGLSCREVDRPGEIAQEVVDLLENENVEDISTEGDRGGAKVVWHPPAWVGDEGHPDTESSARIDAVDGVTGAVFAFGPFPLTDEHVLSDALPKISDRIEDNWRLVHVAPDLHDTGDGLDMVFEMNTRSNLDAWTFGDFYTDVIGWVDELVDSAMDPEPIAEELRRGLRDMDANLDPEDEVSSRQIKVNFKPNPDSVPGFRESYWDSWIVVDASGFDELRFIAGPYRTDEPGAWDRVPAAASSVIDSVVQAYPEMDVSWTKLTTPDIWPDQQTEAGEVQFTASAPEDTVAEDLKPPEMLALLQLLHFDAAKKMPAARESGDPVQQPLDEFERVRRRLRTRADIGDAARRGRER